MYEPLKVLIILISSHITCLLANDIKKKQSNQKRGITVYCQNHSRILLLAVIEKLLTVKIRHSYWNDATVTNLWDDIFMTSNPVC